MNQTKSPFKEHPLTHIRAAMSAKNIELGQYRAKFFKLKADKDHVESNLIRASDGKSHAEKTMNAKASLEWASFHDKLTRAEAEYEFVKLQFKILEYEYFAQSLCLKLDAGLIRKDAE